MKKIIFILIAVFTLQAGNSIQAKNRSNNELKKTAGTVAKSKGAKGETVKLTKEKFLKEIWDYKASPKEWKYKGNKPALIDFYADWCGPCKIAAPILEELSVEYSGKIIIYKVDTQVERELSSVFGISGIPAFLYIPMTGKPSMTSGIARSKEDTKKMFKERIDKLLLDK